MTLWQKILMYCGIAAILAALLFIIYKQLEISNRQETIEKSIVKQKDITESIVRSSSEYVTRQDLETFAKDNKVNLDAIKNDLAKLDGSVAAINLVQVKSQGSNLTNVQSTYSTPNNSTQTNIIECNGTKVECDKDVYGYLKTNQYLKLNESFLNMEVPIGEVGFSASKEKPWSQVIYPRNYKLITVLGVDENRRHYAYNQFSVEINDKKYDLKISEATLKEEYPESKFYWWNPQIFLGINSSYDFVKSGFEFGPFVSLSTSSYGKYKQLPEWSLFNFGVGYGSINKNINMTFEPIMFNLGKISNLLNNTYIGPVISTNFSNSVYGGIGLSVSF